MFHDFTPEGRQRVIAATRGYEQSLKSRVPTRARWEGLGDDEQLFELKGNLDAAGQADAYMVKWDATADGGNGAYAADTSKTYTLHDFQQQHWGLAHEWIRARAIGTRNGTAWMAIESGAPWHLATLGSGYYGYYGDLTYRASAGATVMVRGSAVDLVVWDYFLAASASIAVGSDVGIQYDVEARKWVVTEVSGPC